MSAKSAVHATPWLKNVLTELVWDLCRGGVTRGQSGSVTMRYAGSVTMRYTGSVTMRYAGSVTMRYTGSVTMRYTGSVTMRSDVIEVGGACVTVVDKRLDQIGIGTAPGGGGCKPGLHEVGYECVT